MKNLKVSLGILSFIFMMILFYNSNTVYGATISERDYILWANGVMEPSQDPLSPLNPSNPVNPINPIPSKDDDVDPTKPQPPILTPVLPEPSTSDLTLLQAETVLDSPRWIQSFTKDNKYYYFTQMTNPYKGHLRITRVKYTGQNKYETAHMDLKYFGHGTNIDCTVYKGVTYLWIGSKVDKNIDTTAISCFRFKKNKVYSRKAGNTYSIRMKGKSKYAKNVFPAVSSDQKYLFVRYTYKGCQYFQKYKIYSGKRIKNSRPLTRTKVKATAADFQGFDVHGSYIYTIEGSPRSTFLSYYAPWMTYKPTVVRRINYKSGSIRSRVIRGASNITYREPEGIEVNKKGKMEILFISNTLYEQKCNLYSVK